MDSQKCLNRVNLVQKGVEVLKVAKRGHPGVPHFWTHYSGPPFRTTSPRPRPPVLAGERIVGHDKPVKSAQKGVKKRPLFGTPFRTLFWTPSGHPWMAHEDPRGRIKHLFVLYVLNQNIQFRSGPVLGVKSDHHLVWDPSWVPTHGGWIPGFRDLTYIADP